MLRHVAQPLDARRLQPHIEVESPRHRLVDDRLFLLVQQLDLAAFGADESAHEAVVVVEECDDLPLLAKWGGGKLGGFDVPVAKSVARHPASGSVELIGHKRGFQGA